MSVTYTNQRVTIQTDLVFEWVVLTEDGWLPFTELDKEDLKVVYKAMNHDPLFPPELNTYLINLIK